MEKFYELVIRHRKIIFAVFIGIAVICAMAQKFVSVNYDMNSYLPEDSPSTVALDVMEDEFDGGIPNARVLIYNVTVPEALSYKEKLGEIDGVTDVTWLDDAVTEKQVQILKKTSSIRCVQLRKHSKAREKRYSFGYAVSFIFACYQILWTFPKSRYLCSRYLPLVCG